MSNIMTEKTKEIILKNYFLMRKNLVINKLNQTMLLEGQLKNILNIYSFNKEFRTLNLNFGRITGKTFFSLYGLSDLYKPDDVCILCHTRIEANRVKKLNKTERLSIYSINTRGIALDSFKVVIIEDSDISTKEQIDTVYQILSRSQKLELIILN